MSPMIYYETLKTRREELLREAEKERLIKIAQAGQLSLRERIQTSLGQLLIQTGQRFQFSKSSPVQGTLGH